MPSPFGGWGKEINPEAVERDRAAGMEIKHIAAKHDCHPSTIWRILRNRSNSIPQHMWIRVSQRGYRAICIAAKKSNVDTRSMATAILTDAIEQMISDEGISESDLENLPADILGVD